MGDELGAGRIDASMEVTAAFGVARELLERAEADAQRLRAETERIVRLREREVEMLLAKARRVLEAAEVKATVIIAAARTQALDGLIDLTLDEEIGHVIAPGASRIHLDGFDTRLDRLLASAIAHAVDDAFPLEATA